MRRSWHAYALGAALLILLAVSGARPLLVAMGRFLVVDEDPVKSDAIVVLNTGVEIYPRLIQAARLHTEGWAETVVINGARKSDVLRELERRGFEPCCAWNEDHLRILELLGVNRDRVVVYSVEDAYDTVSEAQEVGRRLVGEGMRRVLVVTSKSHTRRAGMIWKSLFRNQLEVRMVAAKTDIFKPDCWWRDGRQIRWVLAEYGGWLFWNGKRFFER